MTKNVSRTKARITETEQYMLNLKNFRRMYLENSDNPLFKLFEYEDTSLFWVVDHILAMSTKLYTSSNNILVHKGLYHYKILREKLYNRKYKKLILKTGIMDKIKKKEIIHLTKTADFRRQAVHGTIADEYFQFLKPLNKQTLGIIFSSPQDFYNPLKFLKYDGMDYLPYEIFLDNDIYSIEKNYRNYLIKQWKLLKKDKKYPVLFKKYGVNYDADRLELIFYKVLPEIIRFVGVWKKIFDSTNSKIVLLIHAKSTFGYPAMMEAYKKKIKYAEIQHGDISGQQADYVYFNVGELSLNKIDLKKCLLPQITFVDGDYTKRLLIKRGYKGESIITSGLSKFDFLADLKYDRQFLLKKYGLNPDKKIAVWPTQTHDPIMWNCGEIELNTKIAFKTFKEMGDWQLILKLHPGENQKAPLYRKYAREFGLDVKIFDKNINMYELIYLSNVVLTKNSTSGQEAIMLKKPLIIFNIMKTEDVSTFTDFSVALVADKESDLKRLLLKSCSGSYLEKFMKFRKYYLHEKCINTGHAGKTKIEYIKKMIK